jgi:hypothetical protein
MSKFGATGKFPHGSLGPHDEGELTMSVAHDSEGNVHVSFGKPVAWFALPRERAMELAGLLLHHAHATYVDSPK